MTLVWGQPEHGLRLGVGGEATAVRLALENVGRAPLEVLSHVEAGERHYDWFALTIDGRELTLSDARNRSGRVTVALAPGARIEHEVDAAAWALRPVNGAAPLGPAPRTVTAAYAVTGETVWTGRLEAGPATLDA